MGAPVNLIGQKFGKLTVIEKQGTWVAKSGRKGCALWKCKCDCGKIKLLRTSKLKDGSTKSCGCWLKERAKLPRRPRGYAGLTTVYLAYINGAKNKNVSFLLTKDEFHKFTQQNCHYCNRPPSSKCTPKERMKLSTVHGIYIYNGIDRIDSKKGYEIGNCVTACKRCNAAKNDMSYDEFMALIKAIYFNRVKQPKQNAINPNQFTLKI